MPDETETPPEHKHGHHHKHDEPVPGDSLESAPIVEKTAGEFRAEDAELENDQTLAGKQGIQDAADLKALEQYKGEQLEKFPPASDPLKDREDRIGSEKKHGHHDRDEQAETGGE